MSEEGHLHGVQSEVKLETMRSNCNLERASNMQPMWRGSAGVVRGWQGISGRGFKHTGRSWYSLSWHRKQGLVEYS